MEKPIRARLTPGEGRRFAYSVGGVFLLIAGVFLWRGRTLTAQTLAAIGGLLLLAGTLAPSRLGPVFRAWMGLALAISTVTTPVFMGVVYFGVMTPIGILRRTFGVNPVRHEPVGDSYWHGRDPHRARSDLRRQF